MNKKLEATIIYALAYIVATIAAVLSFKYYFKSENFLINFFLADLVGSVVIYLNCILLNSFSLYDPYWSLQCNVISVYFFYQKWNKLDARSILVFILVNIWSIRLNSNLFTNGVDDKSFEDWRYSDFRKKFSTIIGWLVGFLTFILLPTALVFFGCSIPLLEVYESNLKLNLMDLIALIVTLVGILFEAVGDHQLRQSHLINKKKRSITTMNAGLWSLCRHPNYFGEISFWFGLFIFGYAACQKFNNLLLIGPLGIFIIIYFGSLPLMEERQLKRRKDYANYMKQVPFKILPLNFIKK